MGRGSAITLIPWVLVVSAAGGQTDETVRRIIEEGRKRSQVMEHLDHLTNRIGPRLTGSDRLTQACEWAVERFQSWGFEARMEKWGEFPVGFNRGPWFGRVIEPEERMLTFGTAAWSAGTRGRMRGEAALAPKDPEDLRKSKGRLGGKWVLEPRDLRPGFGRIGAGNGEDRAKPELLDQAYEEQGILGLIRSTGDGLVRTGGNPNISWDSLPRRIEINLIEEDWQAIAKQLKNKKKVELEFDIRNGFKKGPIPLYNVVADFRGTEKPDEFVIAGGHIDSWDGATGTTDNGTGVATTMEAARILAVCGVKPRRTIRFMLWSGEEQGLLGSSAWCKAHQDEMDQISAVFVHDGGTNWVSGIAGTPAHQEDFRRVFSPVLRLDPGMPFEIREVAGISAGGSSDHASFLALGVPGFYWAQKGRANYGFGWHTQNDTYDIAIPEYQRHTATIVAVAVFGTSQLDHLLSREGLQSARDTIPTGRLLGVDLDEAMNVTSVTPEGAAARAGVRSGDRLLELDGLKLKDRFVLRKALNQGQPKKALVVERKGERVSLTVAWEK